MRIQFSKGGGKGFNFAEYVKNADRAHWASKIDFSRIRLAGVELCVSVVYPLDADGSDGSTGSVEEIETILVGVYGADADFYNRPQHGAALVSDGECMIFKSFDRASFASMYSDSVMGFDRMIAWCRDKDGEGWARSEEETILDTVCALDDGHGWRQYGGVETIRVVMDWLGL